MPSNDGERTLPHSPHITWARAVGVALTSVRVRYTKRGSTTTGDVGRQASMETLSHALSLGWGDRYVIPAENPPRVLDSSHQEEGELLIYLILNWEASAFGQAGKQVDCYFAVHVNFNFP